jgi:acetylornithine/succinyldiaminopimelate/putrescine aminotransferase
MKSKKYRQNNLKIFCFDLDGVICNTKKNFYKNSKPNQKAIKKINDIYYKGHRIIIFTARFMGRSNENVSLARKKGYKFTYKQLNNWGVKFHKLIFGKPSFDYLIDDKSIGFRKNWHKYLCYN